MPVKNGVYIQNMEQLKAVTSAAAKTMQTDFGLRWNLETAQEDDERAIAIAVAGFYELGGQIISEDAEVMRYIASLQNKQALQGYFKEEK